MITILHTLALILQNCENIKRLLCSVVNDGFKSDHINEFIDICRNIAMVQFRKSKYKEEILIRECYNEKEIIYDLIADIFENREGYYFYINNFFSDMLADINKISEEEIIAKLVVFVRSNVQQRITEIRASYGEFYYKVKKAFESFISRNKENFKEIIFRDKIYIHNCIESEIDFDLNQIPESIFLNELFNNKFKTFSIPEVIRKAFKYINEQEEYNKAVEKIELLNFISKFYKKRLKDKLIKNVEYI